MRVSVAGSLALICALLGCESMRTVKVDNPVVGPPPPRVVDASSQNHLNLASKAHRNKKSSSEETQLARASDGDERDSEVRPVSREVDIQDIHGDTVVATVNESPLFARDVLGAKASNIHMALKAVEHQFKDDPDPQNIVRAKATIQKHQEMILKQNLPAAIDVRLIVLALKAEVKPDQLKTLQESIDVAFRSSKEQELMHSFGVKDLLGLEQRMAEVGLDYQHLKQSYSEVEMAHAYMGLKGSKPVDPDRSEMLAYYDDHRDEYAFPATVKWQQILVKSSKHGSSEGARKVIDEAAQALLDGKSFTEVAREYSEGPTANDGGIYNWMKAGSLVDKELEKKLFQVPVGEVSPVIEAKDGWQIVVVLNRKAAGHLKFEDKQKEIKNILMQKQMRESAEKLAKDLRKSAVIWTIFDDERSPLAANAETDSKESDEQPAEE
ncbi:MAG: peptidylprolyl isomerase [Planctomycetales bacterium]